MPERMMTTVVVFGGTGFLAEHGVDADEVRGHRENWPQKGAHSVQFALSRSSRRSRVAV
jgi:hypothetical protein